MTLTQHAIPQNTVTAVIPTYNRQEMLSRALFSIIGQRCPVDEILVVDNGSTDQTKSMLKKDFPRVRVVIHPRGGVSAARNAGIRNANSSWVAFLDSDDEWLPDKIARQKQVLERHNKVRICHTNELWLNNGKPILQKKKHKKYGGMIFSRCLPLCLISPSSVMIHKSIFDTVGVFDERMSACEDYDLWLRITSRYPVLYLDDPLIIKHGGHADQLSRRYWGMDRFRIYALEKILNDEELSSEYYEEALNELRCKIDIYLEGAKKRNKVKEILQLEEKKKQLDCKQSFLRNHTLSPVIGYIRQ